MIKQDTINHKRTYLRIGLVLFCVLDLIICNVTLVQASTRMGIFFTQWGNSSSGSAQFNYPCWICTDNFDQVYISDPTIGVSIFDTKGNFIRILETPLSSGIATNISGSIYVGDISGNSIWVFDRTGSYLYKFGSYGSGSGMFRSIQGIAINKSGYVFVTDSFKNTVQVFTPTGQFVCEWNVAEQPMGIAISPQGMVCVTTLGPGGVKQYYQNGTLIGNIATSGTGKNQVNVPYGIATDQAGYVYVADSGHNRILVFDANGNLDSSWGEYGSGSQPDQLNNPHGIAINDQHYLFIADTENNRILAFYPQAIADFWTIISIILITAVAIVLVIMRKRVYSRYLTIREKHAQKRALDREIVERERIIKQEEERKKREAEQKKREAEQKKREAEQKRKAALERQRREEEEKRMGELKNRVVKVILELAPQFSRLQVSEIAERSGIIDENLIIRTIQEMIVKKQIDGVYFKSTKSIGFQQHLVEKPFPAEPVPEKKALTEVLRQYEYVGGKVRIKIKVINQGMSGLLRVRCMLNIPDSFRVLRVEPSDYAVEGGTVKMQDLLPKEEKAVAYVLEPMICGKEQFSGTVSGVDAAGNPFVASIAPLTVEVRCPLFANPEEANLPLVKNMALSLPVKSERVFYLPETLSPTTAFDLAKSAISERDVRFVGSVTTEDRKEGDSFEESVWFYGTTKVDKKRYVLSAAVSEKDRTIRLATACDDEAGCTGFLAETGAAVRRELVRRGAYESEKTVIELVCEKCGATLPSAPTIDHDVRCPECQWSWRAKDFFH